VVAGQGGSSPRGRYTRITSRRNFCSNRSLIADERQKPSRPREGILRQAEAPSHQLHEPLVPDAAAERVAVLPSTFRDRYRVRVKEITRWACRELDEYLKVLEAEYRAAQERKPRPGA